MSWPSSPREPSSCPAAVRPTRSPCSKVPECPTNCSSPSTSRCGESSTTSGRCSRDRVGCGRNLLDLGLPEGHDSTAHVVTIRDGQIVAMQDYRSRDDAVEAEAGGRCGGGPPPLGAAGVE